MGAGEAAQEQEDKTGEYDARVASGVGVLIGILDRFGAGKVIPKSKLATMTGEEVVDALMKAGKPNAAAAVGRRIAGSTLGEAGTEVAKTPQSWPRPQQWAASTPQRNFVTVPSKVRSSAALSVAAQEPVSRPQEQQDEASEQQFLVVTHRPTHKPQTDLANRLQAIADRDGIDLKNINLMDPKGARAAVDQAHKEITGELKQLRSEIRRP